MKKTTTLMGVLIGALAFGGCSTSDDGDFDIGDPPAADPGTTPAPANSACTVAAQCPSGFCVDGVCCDTACDGNCVSCNQPQSPGKCLPLDKTDDPQSACKLKSGAVCSTNDQCASDICKTIVVPPDPNDPYDVGFSYTGCQ